LIKIGAFIHRPHLTVGEALAYLERTVQQRPNPELLKKGKAAYDLLRAQILYG
jgi:uncharacterized protein